MKQANPNQTGDIKMKDNATFNSSSASTYVVGGAVILMGVIFLITNMGGRTPQNWWAVFMYVPAILILAQAYSVRQKTGSLNGGSLIGALSIIVVATIFLLNLSFGTVWPVFIILGGISMLLSSNR